MIDWSYLQSFVAVAEHGSLSAAAEAQGGSQPTLSRHIAHLEQMVGTRLFDRTKAGMSLTETGAEMLVHAREMANAAARLSMRGQSHDQEIAGTVRVTASQIVATYLLPDLLAQLHEAHPQIEVEVVASDTTNNLLRREADIAIRMYRPTQEDVISQHLGDLELGAFAAHSYIARKGEPRGAQDLLHHDVIGYDRSTLIIDGLRAFGLNVTRDFFKFRSDDQVVCWQMVRAGFGIGFNQVHIGAADPGLSRLFTNEVIGQMPVWLTAHPEVRQTPRIRKVYDHLRDHLGKLLKSART
jgi:DNA-binding transcriptional LysR family regulator